MARKVNLNSDMGEGFGAYDIGNDTTLLDIITSANVACGFHAGDPNVMDRVCKQAKAKGEDAKVSVRNIRRRAMEELHRIKKDGEAGEDEVGRAEKDLDKSTASYVHQIDELVKHKEGELLEV